ncbi:hypothetical protein [Aurantiacibacter poecillastricola]|uniref:hypothetical protein n=1 Tax=Aurantiacibacter poecillastricola TaxID=3064385 RepID=UPI00273D4AA2|nr:hypothetical protein [Aurantiacibacter sp. 219JJ12-13]MDP5262905.1 hypothetical protein [Aurantiacibacter sp. 219JJ12-13]
MTHYLGIISAYGTVAILAWLTALLYPRWLPAAPIRTLDHRWRNAALLLVAFALAYALASFTARGHLLPGDGALASAINLLVILLPVIAYLALQRSRAAILLPQSGIGRSLLVGVAFALCGIAAYFSVRAGRTDMAIPGAPEVVGDALLLTWRSMLRLLVLAAFLALVIDGWSGKAAIAIAAIAIAATQIPSLLSDGFSPEWLGILVAHVALVAGLVSAIVKVRNIVWFWPVLTLLNMLQLYTA